MSINSVESLLEWFRVKPRTEKWDAIMAFDRRNTNTVLLQEYINRFSVNNYMPPVTFEMADSTGTLKVYLFDYTFDTPRLSFENANISGSMAKLTSKVIQGVHVGFEMASGATEWSVIKLGAHSPLAGPDLVMDIELKTTKGTVTESGRVELDISDGENYRMNYDDTENMRKLAGDGFKKKFGDFPEKIKKYILNEIAPAATDQMLEPSEFHIRTHHPEGANIRGAANQGEGAVLMFVTMKGGKNGSIPVQNSDLKYLIPDGYSASLLLGHQFIMNRIISEGCKGIINTQNKYKIHLEGPDEGFVEKLTVVDGVRRKGTSGNTPLPNFDIFELKELVLGLGKTFVDSAPGTSSFSQKFENDKLSLTWTGSKQQPVSIRPKGGATYSENLGTQWIWENEFTFQLLPSGALRLAATGSNVKEIIRVTPEKYVGVPAVTAHFSEIAAKVEPQLLAELQASVSAFVDKSKEIDPIRLNSLLFRGNNVVQAEHVAFPGDLVTFGKVGPRQTTFVISPLEPVMGHNQIQKFTTDPVQTGVSWKVEHISANPGSSGAIDAQGNYTAPAAAQITGRHVRVRVTATKGTNTSSALVTVLVFDMDVSPQIQIAGAGTSVKRQIKAGALGGGALDWKIADPSSGARIVKSDEEGLDHVYTPGPQDKTRMFSVDEVVVTDNNVSPPRSQSALVLVTHRYPSLIVKIDTNAGLPDNQLKLMAFWASGEPVDTDEEELTWEKLLGSGSVNGLTGVFTADLSGALPYAVIIANIPPIRAGRDSDDGYILLPIPMFSIPDTMRMMRATKQ